MTIGEEDKQYRSDAFAAIHETMEALHEARAIPQTTMRQFDEMCLEPAPILTGEDIRSLRERENVSQPVFAKYLNVSKNLVSDWERGVKKPGGPALRLLAIVEKHGLELLA
ncbi:DNA-binding transcriptional regulator [Synechococcus sp. PCC 7336]|uniref:helix-turn-helix domain-containing protein n=1 Tax=Synechococcus sp. PCC 7336 TaxID=195250 RepID=UPI00034ABA7A|nr:DNA-binding transcriptional regulator [Synechococcus sp. PCC 7336]